MMAITDGTWSDGGALEDLRHCGNTSNTYRGSVAAAGLAASRLTQLQLELAKTQIFDQPKLIAGDSQLQSTIVDCKPPPS